MNICLRKFCIRRSVDSRVGGGLFGQPNLCLVVDSEVGQLCLYTNSDLLSDVGHLERLLPEVPLVPAVVGLDVLLDEVSGGLHALVHHERSGDREEGMHAVLALEECGEGGLWEVILHLEQVDELGLATAPLDDLVQVLLWLLDELVDAHFVSEHAILLSVLEDTEVGFSRHEEAILLNNVDKAEAEEVERDMHEVGGAVRHQTDDVGVGPDYLRVCVGGDVLLDLAHPLRLLHVEALALKDDVVRQRICHLVLELKQHLEKLASENCQILFFQQLRVDLRQTVELWVDLILRNGGLVTDQVLQLCDLFDVLSLEALDVGLGNLHVTLQLQDVDKELALVGQLILIVFDLVESAGGGTQLLQHVEVHGVTVTLLHDLRHLLVQLVNQRAGGVVDDFRKTLQTDTSLANIAVK